jgi:hypothetical protein
MWPDRKVNTEPYGSLAEVIRKEIVETLVKRGVCVRWVEVDIKPDCLNVSLNIRDSQNNYCQCTGRNG